MENVFTLRYTKMFRESSTDDEEPLGYSFGQIIYLGNGLIAHNFDYGTISIVNIHNGKHVKDLKHTMHAFYATNDNKLVLSVIDDPRRIEIYDLTTFKSVRIENDNEISHFAHIKEGLLAHTEHAIYDDSSRTHFSITILSYDDKSVKQVGRFYRAHPYSIHCLQGLPGDMLASGAGGCNINIWDVNKMVLVKTLNGHEGAIFDLKLLSPNRLISSSCDYTFRVWDINKGKCLKTIEQVVGPIEQVVGPILMLPKDFFAVILVDLEGRLLDSSKIVKIKFYESQNFRCVSEINADDLDIDLKSFHYVQNNCFMFWGGKHVKIFDFKGANRDQFAALKNY